jgi:hypothetical protein
MGLGTVITNDLPDLHQLQFSDKPGTDNEEDEKSGQSTADGPERYIAENVQEAEVFMKRIK